MGIMSGEVDNVVLAEMQKIKESSRKVVAVGHNNEYFDRLSTGLE